MNLRHKKILDIIDEKNVISLQDIVKIFSISEATARRDLVSLEERNLLYRTHGGAMKRVKTRGEEDSVKAKVNENTFEKKRVAKYIFENIITTGATIYLDAGTSTYELIDYLKEKRVHVVTNSSYHLQKLIQNKIHTTILGGTLKHSTQAIIGHTALTQLDDYSFDFCFIGCNGIDEDFGLSTADENEAYLKSKALKNSKKRFILADEKKFSHRKFQKFANIESATIISYKVPTEYKKYDNIIEVESEDK